ncbi:sulfate reduction electron transfer complex DsrMKJOP subunit DsrJ [Chloroflexota bacterium]
MYDASKIIPGLIVFLCIITFPLWLTVANGKLDYVPEPEIVTEEEQCVESAESMRANHMDLLVDWREIVVREGTRIWVASDGKEYNMSLTSTCLDCHSNKAEFCDQCHDYVGVEPYCWNCHVVPEGGGN